MENAGLIWRRGILFFYLFSEQVVTHSPARSFYNFSRTWSESTRLKEGCGLGFLMREKAVIIFAIPRHTFYRVFVFPYCGIYVEGNGTPSRWPRESLLNDARGAYVNARFLFLFRSIRRATFSHCGNARFPHPSAIFAIFLCYCPCILHGREIHLMLRLPDLFLLKSNDWIRIDFIFFFFLIKRFVSWTKIRCELSGTHSTLLELKLE